MGITEHNETTITTKNNRKSFLIFATKTRLKYTLHTAFKLNALNFPPNRVT